MELTDITPKPCRCGIAACPAIFRSDRGTFVVIGRRVDGQDLRGVSHRVGNNENVIEIPEELLSGIIKEK